MSLSFIEGISVVVFYEDNEDRGQLAAMNSSCQLQNVNTDKTDFYGFNFYVNPIVSMSLCAKTKQVSEMPVAAARSLAHRRIGMIDQHRN
jgi:hypothetical protein